MTSIEIANAVVNSDRVSDHTGLTNFERFHFICHTFGVGAISISEDFDFDDVIDTCDSQFIMAAYHLASLQWEWVERCNQEGLCDPDWYNITTHHLLNSQRKLLWAESFIRCGDKPPPYPFIN